MSEYQGPERRSISFMEKEWHQTKAAAISIIGLLLVQIGTSIWWASGIDADVRTLKERPELTERVIKLEALTSEHGRMLNRFNDTLDKLDSTMEKFGTEQSRRLSTIQRVEEHLKKEKH